MHKMSTNIDFVILHRTYGIQLLAVIFASSTTGHFLTNFKQNILLNNIEICVILPFIVTSLLTGIR